MGEKVDGKIKYSYVTCKFSGANAHMHMLDDYKNNKVSVGAARIMKILGKWYIIMSVKVPLHTVGKDEFTNMSGIDMGIRNPCAVSHIGGGSVLYSSKDKDVVNIWNSRERVRKQVESLKSKGTRASKRRLRLLANKEKRLNRDFNHILSARVVGQNALIGAETLKDVRDRIESDSVDVKSAGLRTLNKLISQWSFFDLQSKIEYKTWLSNGMFIYVDPKNTSRRCPNCGHTHKRNRPNNGITFLCERCGFTAHADIVAGYNILISAAKKVNVTHGFLSMTPTVLTQCIRRVNTNVTTAPPFKWYNKYKPSPLGLGN